jgi:hypothetical protein
MVNSGTNYTFEYYMVIYYNCGKCGKRRKNISILLASGFSAFSSVYYLLYFEYGYLSSALSNSNIRKKHT